MVSQRPYHNTLEAVQEKLGSDLYLYQILEETPNGVMVVNLDHKVIYGNPAASRFLGVSYGELAERSLQDVFSPDNEKLCQLVADYFETTDQPKDAHFRHEVKIRQEDQVTQILDVVLAYPPSVPQFYILYLIDITHRKTLEAKLRRRSAFFHNLIDSSTDGIIAADMKGHLIVFNQGAQNLLGYTEEEAFFDLHVSGLYSEDVAHALLKRMRSSGFGGRGKLLRHELSVRHKDGRDIPVSFSGGLIYDRQEEIATFGIFTDLSPIMSLEEDLEQTHQRLMQSEKMAGLGRLAAGVAHEINNPMSGIMLYANMVQEELESDSPLQEDLKTIIHEAERCKVIVADLLEFSHQTSYEMSLVDVNEVVEKTFVFLKNQPLLQNVQVQMALDDHLAPIFGNSIRLNQVVMNIIVNAGQSMEGEGRLTITSRNRGNNDLVEVLFTDTGPGIEKSLQENIFDPFFTTKGAGEGTGLGLSVSYAIVKEHKGSIRLIESSENGTTFALRFPAVMEALNGEEHEY